MHDRVELGRPPRAILPYAGEIALVRPFEDPVAGDMESFLLHVILDPSHYIPIVNAGRLQQAGEILDAEMTVRAPVTLLAPGRVFSKDLLARKWRIAPPPPGGISTDVTICVPYVVTVLFVEGVVRDEFERLAPENQAVLQ